MQPFTQRIIHTIRSIPRGCVMSYGQIAKCAGNPRAARQVARVLHSLSDKYDLPWHRVVNAKGAIVIKDSIAQHTQKSLLEEEGIVVINNKISLKDYQYIDPPIFEDG
ncbi:methylated-DNA-protein-cysteine methyltransferase related protein [Halobacillus karajensis]|uniref:Methylated-DNA--protein-cysteine methyltransferase n=1 Tax=Halobacillus karajensis TaxID=195088 RepID=A0A024P5M0_9BACI|nr:MGMT family protein [Halobacillus karajensis]CDQ18666.1 Methylated-DNA--protein-cysteine methyltransferase [Halobacillus karajensis]CDQ23262.1 Methylated-DNA--protein-cysteine methyltransferase [Halobacillus karajensis]CDQ26744.1 Methylated-DNA--protein-cysteine methyltransferase [Halobacillus karajensis]SEH48413.1 methylated-DNA-protein-cysteine methyltransferase related protein [Halobacillus karajensis]